MKVSASAVVPGGQQTITVEVEKDDLLAMWPIAWDNMDTYARHQALTMCADVLVIRTLREGNFISDEYAAARLRDIMSRPQTFPNGRGALA